MVLAWDVAGQEGTSRRDGARAAHTTSIRALWDQGHVILGAGILDDEGVVRGSLVVVDYDDRSGVDSYLGSEPFVQADVWERIEVHPLRVPDFYLDR
jgi:uncharacterized protein YciI